MNEKTSSRMKAAIGRSKMETNLNYFNIWIPPINIATKSWSLTVL